MEILIQAIWAIAPGIIVGVVMAVWNKQQKHRTDMDEQREKERIESERLRISTTMAHPPCRNLMPGGSSLTTDYSGSLP